jgi:hypothetical protein
MNFSVITSHHTEWQLRRQTIAFNIFRHPEKEENFYHPIRKIFSKLIKKLFLQHFVKLKISRAIERFQFYQNVSPPSFVNENCQRQ